MPQATPDAAPDIDPRAMAIAHRQARDMAGPQAHRRLRILALLAMAGFGLGTTLTLLIPLLIGDDEPITWALLWLCIGMVLASGLVYGLTGRVPERWSSRLAHGYIIAGALAMSITEILVVPGRHEDISGVSGICIWIVLFPMVIASRPPATLLTATICAALLPLCYLLAPADLQTYSAGHLVEWFVPGFFCAGLAYLASRSITALADDLARARQRIRELAGYQLTSKLATGGMGEVWRAKHRLLPQEAAVKFIRTDRDATPDSDLAERFRSEARAAASLTSPNSVRIYDFGISEEGQLFLVMEYIDGIDLDRLVRLDGPLGPERCIHILVQVCRALEELHAAGLVHRDIKPDNVLLCRLGGQPDVAKLIDLGLAIEVSVGEKPDLVAGTVGYLAPEILLGSAQPSPASDLYGLGCLGWFLLTGQEVFLAADDQEKMLAHISDPVPTPSAPIPGPLLHLLQRCLEKHPSARPASARDLRLALLVMTDEQAWDEDTAEAWWTERGDGLVGASRMPTPTDITPRLLSHSGQFRRST